MWLDEDDDKDILVVQCEEQNEKCWNCMWLYSQEESNCVIHTATSNTAIYSVTY